MFHRRGQGHLYRVYDEGAPNLIWGNGQLLACRQTALIKLRSL